MKVVLAFDKFKGCATSQQLNEAARQALNEAFPSVTVDCVPVADGGDGTVDVLASARQGQWQMMQAPGPLLQLPQVNARYFLCDDGTAFIEVAAASGLALIPREARDVMRATTLGTGLLMRDAMERGSRHIVLGLGGSATCDAGMGIMCALGAEFTDSDGHYLYPSGESIERIAHIETRGIPQEVRECRFTLLTDVDNPLYGEKGAAAIYGPQKGANPNQVEQLERGMQHLAAIIGDERAMKAGCGAAGGIPALMGHLLDCQLLAGAPYILAENGLDKVLEGADLVITGEGRLDRQTMMGKGPGQVIKMAQRQGVPVAAICGIKDEELDVTAAGLTTAIAVSDGLPHEEAMQTDGTLARVATAATTLLARLLSHGHD